MRTQWAVWLALVLPAAAPAQQAAEKPKLQLLGNEPLCFILMGNRTFAQGDPSKPATLPGLMRKYQDGKAPHVFIGATQAWPAAPDAEKWADYLKPQFAKARDTKLPIVVLAQLPVEMLLGFRGKEFIKDENDQANIARGADGLQDFCGRVLKMGAEVIVISDRGYGEKQPGSLENWRAHAEFARRGMPGVWRGPQLHQLTSLKPQLFAADGYHFSGAGGKAFHLAWFLRLCEIDGIAAPAWAQQEFDRTVK